MESQSGLRQHGAVILFRLLGSDENTVLDLPLPLAARPASPPDLVLLVSLVRYLFEVFTEEEFARISQQRLGVWQGFVGAMHGAGEKSTHGQNSEHQARFSSEI